MNRKWWTRPLRRWVSGLPEPKRSRASRATCRPRLEPLEHRLVPATVTYENPASTSVLIADLQAAPTAPPGTTTIIDLTPGFTYSLTTVDKFFYGPNGLPPIASNVIIHGNGATIARDTNPADNTPAFRLFYVSGGLELPAGSLTMDNVTLEGGLAEGGSGFGGGGGLGAGGTIFNQGTLNLTDVTLANNTAQGGRGGTTVFFAGGQIGGGGGGMGTQGDSDGSGGREEGSSAVFTVPEAVPWSAAAAVAAAVS